MLGVGWLVGSFSWERTPPVPLVPASTPPALALHALPCLPRCPPARQHPPCRAARASARLGWAAGSHSDRRHAGSLEPSPRLGTNPPKSAERAGAPPRAFFLTGRLFRHSRNHNPARRRSRARTRLGQHSPRNPFLGDSGCDVPTHARPHTRVPKDEARDSRVVLMAPRAQTGRALPPPPKIRFQPTGGSGNHAPRHCLDTWIPGRGARADQPGQHDAGLCRFVRYRQPREEGSQLSEGQRWIHGSSWDVAVYRSITVPPCFQLYEGVDSLEPKWRGFDGFLPELDDFLVLFHSL